MPPLIISVGQAGISPLGSFWSLNFEEIKKSRKAQQRQSPPQPPSTTALQRMFYFDRTWYRPRWLMVDSEAKVIDSQSHLLVSSALRKEGETAVHRHCKRHTVRSHSGLGGCWAKGFYNSGGLRSRKSRASALATPSPAVSPATATTTTTTTTTPPPPPPASAQSKKVKPKAKGWNQAFAKPTDHNATTQTLVPTALRRVSAQLSSSGIQTSCPTFLVSHSLTGGTGSGLTSSLLPSLRDLQPKASIVAYTISPFLTTHRGIASVTDSTGPLHAYNSILTLVPLREFADAVIMKSNGEVRSCVREHQPCVTPLLLTMISRLRHSRTLRQRAAVRPRPSRR